MYHVTTQGGLHSTPFASYTDAMTFCKQNRPFPTKTYEMCIYSFGQLLYTIIVPSFEDWVKMEAEKKRKEREIIQMFKEVGIGRD